MGKMTHDVVATVGEYKKGGETMKRYVNLGKLFTGDDGRISAKFDTIPVSPEWNGWVSFYPGQERDDAQRGGGQRSAPAPAPGRAVPSGADADGGDSIPF